MKRLPEFVPDDFTRILRTIFDETVRKYSGGDLAETNKDETQNTAYTTCALLASPATRLERCTKQFVSIVLKTHDHHPGRSKLFLVHDQPLKTTPEGGIAVRPHLVEIHLCVSMWDTGGLTRELSMHFSKDLVPYGLNLLEADAPERDLVLEVMNRAIELGKPFPVFYKQQASAA